MHVILALAAVLAQAPPATGTARTMAPQNVMIAAMTTPSLTKSPEAGVQMSVAIPSEAIPKGVPEIRIQALILLTLAGLCLAAAGLGAIVRPDKQHRFRSVLELLAGLFLFLGSWGLIIDDARASGSERFFTVGSVDADKRLLRGRRRGPGQFRLRRGTLAALRLKVGCARPRASLRRPAKRIAERRRLEVLQLASRSGQLPDH